MRNPNVPFDRTHRYDDLWRNADPVPFTAFSGLRDPDSLVRVLESVSTSWSGSVSAISRPEGVEKTERTESAEATGQSQSPGTTDRRESAGETGRNESAEMTGQPQSAGATSRSHLQSPVVGNVANNPAPASEPVPSLTLIDVLEAAIANRAAREVEVTIIKPGISRNGLRYSPGVLRESLPLWEGAAAFVDHPGALDLGRAGGRSIRDLVGVYHSVHYDDGPSAGIRATLRFNPSGHWLFDLVESIVEDRQAGKATPDVGISADMLVVREAIPPGGNSERRPAWDVNRIVRVNSADLVVNPSAGGRFDRILEADQYYATGESLVNGSSSLVKPEPGARNQEPETRNHEPDASHCHSHSEEEARGIAHPSHYNRQEATMSSTLYGSEPGTGQNPNPTASRQVAHESTAEVTPTLETLQNELAELREVRNQLAQQAIEARVRASGLPPRARQYVQSQFQSLPYDPASLDRAIESVRDLLGDVFTSPVSGMGFARPTISVGQSSLDRIQVAVDRLFGIEPPDALKDTPRLSGIREAYILITGDRHFDGRYHWEESVVREANEVTTSVMANVVLNSMTKRLVKDYQDQPRWWETIVSQVALSDMKEQHRILLNDFASLSTVAEDDPYLNTPWADSRENYTPSKRGNLVHITLETIVNDDLRAVTKIPTKLAVAANITINEFVAGLFTANSGEGPAMADTVRVFNAAHGNNLGSSALSSDSLQAAITVMHKFTNSAGKRLGVQPRFLLVPPDLIWTAQVLTESQLVPGNLDNDINVLRGAVQPIAVPQFTDVNDWYLMADPAVVEGIEIGFLNGRTAPELFVQDSPAVGTVFTHDAIRYKVRHIYGGGWLDWRAAYGSVV